MKKNDDTMGVWNDPELEARVVAMLMGELSEFETAELEQELEKSPELRLFRDRMVEVQSLITTVETEAGDDEEWKLSPERRKNLLDSFAEEPERAIEREVSTTSIQWKNIASVAACFVLTMLVMAVMFPVKLFKRATVGYSEEQVVIYDSAESLPEEKIARQYANEFEPPELPESVGKKNTTRGRNVYPKTDAEKLSEYRPAVPKQAQIGDPDMVQMSDKPTAYPKPAHKKPLPPASGAIARNGRRDVDGDGFSFEEERKKTELYKQRDFARLETADEALAKPELSREMKSNPSAPSSDMSKVIGSSTPRGGVAVPTPDIAALEPSTDFGGGQDFGSGWGSGGEGSGGEVYRNSDRDEFTIKEEEASLSGKDGKNKIYAGREIIGTPFSEPNLDPLGDENLNNATVDRIALSGLAGETLFFNGQHDGRRLQQHAQTNGKANRTPLYAFDVNGVGEKSLPQSWDSSASLGFDDKFQYFSHAAGANANELHTQNRPNVNLYLADDLGVSSSHHFSSAHHFRSVDQSVILGSSRKADLGRLEDLKNGELGLAKETAKFQNREYSLMDLSGGTMRRQLQDVYKKTKDIKDEQSEANAELEELGDDAEMIEGIYEKAKQQGKPGSLIHKEVVRRKSLISEADKGENDLRVEREWQKLDKKNKVKSTEPRVVLPFKEEVITAQNHFSTFSLNVSDVSFKLAKVAMLERGEMPEASKVRVEEFVNAFDYGDSSASVRDKVACAIEQCAHPFYQQRNLMRVSMKTAAMGRNQPLKLTILLDNSGSMEREDREATVLKAMQVLAQQLGPQDEVTLISFARNARLVVDSLKGNQAGKLVKLIQEIPSEGGTNLSLGLEEARKITKARMKKGSMSRIVLITDGAANLGNANPDSLTKMVEEMRQEGIAFDACGVGAKELNDDVLEALTRKGDGRYYFINKPEEANANFAQKIAGALRPAAQNVKVQVVFNPKRVKKHKLLGFEKHRLKKEDFRNDKVDAAEMAANEAGNALYQTEIDPTGEGDVGVVFVRFRDMSTGRMVERSWTIPYDAQAPSLSQAKPSMQLAAVAGLLGERLRSSENLVGEMQQLAPSLGKLRTHYHCDQRVLDLIRMCEVLKK